VALLETHRLTAFYGDFQALYGIDAALDAGETLAIIGANGAGKSTFLKTVTGLLPAEPGGVVLDGRPIGGLPPAEIVRLGISLVPEGRRLFPSLSVEENLRIGAYGRREAGYWTLERIYDLFPALMERREAPSQTLSGGEQQMAAIGRGIMSRPKLLMIDELSLGLAPRLVERLSEALLEINRNGLTILLVEQDVMTAFEIARHALIIETGRVTRTGATQALADDPSIRQAYLGL
jgi:branched-chain amino acid transport system ATP-binding protein